MKGKNNLKITDEMIGSDELSSYCSTIADNMIIAGKPPHPKGRGIPKKERLFLESHSSPPSKAGHSGWGGKDNARNSTAVKKMAKSSQRKIKK